MKTVVTMSQEGRLTVPEEARQAIQVTGEAVFELEVLDHALVLRPTGIPPEDAWAYAPEHVERVKRALQQPLDQDLRLTREELERLTPEELQRLVSGTRP